MRDIVACARGWIGTPYRHQAVAKGFGVDCLGLLRGIWREIYGREPEVVPAYSADWSEPARQELLWETAQRHLCEKSVSDHAPGDLLLFRMRSGAVAKHLGIAAEIGQTPTFIHAYSGHCVVESPLSTPWARRIVARFSFPKRGV